MQEEGERGMMANGERQSVRKRKKNNLYEKRSELN